MSQKKPLPSGDFEFSMNLLIMSNLSLIFTVASIVLNAPVVVRFYCALVGIAIFLMSLSLYLAMEVKHDLKHRR